jgi:ligand-binding SRPBCC domain-containing protein
MFEDVQISGPFKTWRHRHIVLPHASGALLRDEIEFEPPLSFVGKSIAPVFIVSKLEKMFAYRHEVTRKWCEE